MIKTEPFEQWPAEERIAYLQGTLRDIAAQDRRSVHTARYGSTKFTEKIRKQLRQAEAELKAR